MATLFINTAKDDLIEVSIKDDEEMLARKVIRAPHTQAEKLLPLIDSILGKSNLSLRDIKKIKVNNRGGSFTGLRIGVVTANALGYALGAPAEGRDEAIPRFYERKKIKGGNFDIVKPLYSKEPNITKKKTISVD